MLVRILSGAVLMAILIPSLFLSATPVFDILITAACVMACYEMLNCLGFKKVWKISLPSFLIAAFIPLCVRQVIDVGVGMAELILLVFIVYLFILLSIAVFSHGKYSIQDVSSVFVLIFYIVFGFMAILSVRNISVDDKGKYLYLLIFISAWVTDTGAYFTGVLFGKHKLIPDVSPKKTVEGAIGGLFFCVASFVIFGLIMKHFYGYTPNYIILCVLGLVLAVVSMCGDLVASLVKRQYNIKDYSKLIPGHGGIMDRFDSLIATASVLSVVLNLPFILQNIL